MFLQSVNSTEIRPRRGRLEKLEKPDKKGRVFSPLDPPRIGIALAAPKLDILSIFKTVKIKPLVCAFVH